MTLPPTITGPDDLLKQILEFGVCLRARENDYASFRVPDHFNKLIYNTESSLWQQISKRANAGSHVAKEFHPPNETSLNNAVNDRVVPQHINTWYDLGLDQIIFLFNKCTTEHMIHVSATQTQNSTWSISQVQNLFLYSHLTHITQTCFLCYLHSTHRLHPKWRVGMHQYYFSNNKLHILRFSPLTDACILHDCQLFYWGSVQFNFLIDRQRQPLLSIHFTTTRETAVAFIWG